VSDKIDGQRVGVWWRWIGEEDIHHNEVWDSCEREAIRIVMGMGRMRDRSLVRFA
jgi:hypothetical protein